MYEELTVEKIKSDILSKLTSDIDTREGSFFNDMISAVAYEIWKSYQSLDAIVPIAFVDETSGEYIDKRCSEYGITRKPGTKAIANMSFVGINGTVIPKGKVFLTDAGLEFLTDASVTIINGEASVTATAEEIGEGYNVAAGTILRQYVSLNGLTSVTNNIAATGGSDPETDAALVARLYNHLQKPATSGNAYQYRKWALEVPGVGDAKIFPLWNGPGTVKVVIVDNDKLPVTNSLTQQTSDYIEEHRPIGATVTVVSGTAKTISISATLVLASGYSLQVVTNSFSNSMKEYFKSIAFSTSYISYAKIGTILLGTDGIIDYSGFKINNGLNNIALGDEEIPVLGSVNVGV
jgi:uncharacterized phage protein gp47/JayE